MRVVDENMGVVDENLGIVDRTQLGSSIMMISSRSRIVRGGLKKFKSVYTFNIMYLYSFSLPYFWNVLENEKEKKKLYL